MSTIDNLVEFLRSEFSSIRDITDDWASSSIESNYTDFSAVSEIFTPSFYEEDRVTVRLRQLLSNLAHFELECDDPEVWGELTKIDISGRQICVLLWFSMEWALVKNSSFELVERGSLAACAYLHLSSIKGSKAYNIFNPYLYQKCLQVFRSLYRCLTFDAREAGSKNKNYRHGRFKARQQEEELMEDDEGEAEEEDVVTTFDKSEVNHLFKEASNALFVLLGKVSLGGYAEIPMLTTLLVRDMARIDCHTETKVDIVENLREFKKLRRLSDRSFAIMHRLIENRHTQAGFLVVSRIVFPRLAFWTFECDVIPSSMAIPAIFNTWCNLMLKFIKIRVEVGHVGELRTIFRVLENLYQRCTDRLEYRTRQAQSILSVLQLLPLNYAYDYVQRIDVFSKNQRVAARNIAIEIVPLILKNLDLSGPDPGSIEHTEDGNETVNTENTRDEGDDGEEELGTEKDFHGSSDAMDEDQNYRGGEKGGSDGDSDSEADESPDEEKREKNKPKEAKKAFPEKPMRVPTLPALYECVIQSCLDKASTVRLRAMFHLKELVEDDQHRDMLFRIARTMFEKEPKIFIGVTEEDGEDDEDQGVQVDESRFLDNSEIVIDNLILHVILGCASDDSAGVRKYALIALQSLFPHLDEVWEAQSAVTCLKECCLDSSLMVRKQGAEVLDYLLGTNKEHRDILEEGWLTAVLPMVNDREQSVQHMISQIVTKTIVNPLMGETDPSAWNLLHAIELENNNRRLLLRALMIEYQGGNIKSALVDSLYLKLDSKPEEVDVIWMLLADLSAIFTVKPDKAFHAWFAIEDGNDSNRVRYISRVLSRSCGKLSLDAKTILREDIKSKIVKFRIDSTNISGAYLCLAKLVDGIGEECKGRARLEKVGRNLLRLSRRHIRQSLLKIDEEYNYPEMLEARETLLIRVITTIGEVVQFSPKLMKSGVRLFDALKTILSSDIINENELPVLNPAIPSVIGSPISSRMSSPTQSRATSPTPSIFSAGDQQDDDQIGSQNGPVIPAHILAAATTHRRALLTPRVRAHAVLTIGKFCLMDEKIAKSTIPVFVKQLRLNRDHVIRNNIALVVCDLCIRYTSMVDRYSPIVAACLKDTSTLVRQQILEMLTSLIKEQFIRWEGQIMYRFVTTILDENAVISEYTKFCLRDVLLLQFPEMFSNHFIECLMYFNNVPGNCEREVVETVVDDAHRVTIHGPANEENRMTIYRFMLSTFDDRRKFTLMAHICTQILCPVMSGKLDYKDPCVFALIKDSLTVMSLKEIKLNMDVGKGPDEEEEPPAVVVAAAKEIITQTFRKAMIEYVMPTLLDLRVYLTEIRSPLRGPLYSVFRGICREHKEHIDEFLDGDRQLKAEVEYDIYRFEMREKAERAAAIRRAEEAAKERRRSRHSLLVVNREEECALDGTQMGCSVTESVAENQAVPIGARPNLSEGDAAILKRTLPIINEEPEDVFVEKASETIPYVSSSPKAHAVAVADVAPTNGDQGMDVVADGGAQEAVIAGGAAQRNAQQGNPVLADEIPPNASAAIANMPTATSSASSETHDSKIEVDEIAAESDDATLGKENCEEIVSDPQVGSSARVPAVPSLSTISCTSRRAKISPSTSDESYCVRAVSTPNKPIADLTFSDLNLSAIEGEGRRLPHWHAAFPRKSARRSSRMGEIEEEHG